MSDLPAARAGELDLQAVLDALHRAVIVTDPQARILLWNRQAELLYGWTAEEVVGRAVTEVLVPAAGEGEAAQIVTEVNAGGTWQGDFALVRKDGTPVRVWVRDQPVVDADGEVIAIVGASEDVTDLRLVEQQNADLTEHLRLALDAGRLGTFRWDRATGIVVWDEKLEALFGLAPGTFEGTFEAYVALLHPGDREMVLGVVEDALTRGSHYAVEHRVVWPDGTVRWLHGSGQVTFDAAGNVTGTIGCSRDITVQVELDRQRDELTRRALDAAERERINRERLEVLSAINDALAAAGTREEVMANVVHAAVPAFADWCSLHVLGDGPAPDVAVAHADPKKVAYARALRALNPWDPDAPRGIPKVIRTGEPDFFPIIDDAALDEIDASDELRQVVADLGLRSGIQVPLRKRGRVIGALQLVMTGSHRLYTEDDFTLAQAIASRVASTLENRRLAQQQREIASALQASLLPATLPEIPGIRLAVRYWANGETVEVGGDFYDAFPIDEHTWGLVIGDVCGTGPKAAAITGLARHSIAAAAWRGADHRTVLQTLNTTLRRRGAEAFCTALYATIETGDTGSTLELASAGHPLPVLVTAAGEVSLIGAPGRLAGLFDDIEVSVRSRAINPGDCIVFYTDGATDVAPPHALDPTQLQELVRKAAATGPDPEDIADRLEKLLSAILPIADRRDDIAILVVSAT
jgi:PAS domain S-box-containing protein